MQTLTNTFRESFWYVVYSLIVGVTEAYWFRRSYLDAEIKNVRLEKILAEARLTADANLTARIPEGSYKAAFLCCRPTKS